MEESQRQNLVMAFNNVLRTSALAGVVDLQRAALGFSALLDQVPPGAPIPLEPLYDFLIEQKGPEPGVREVIVFMKSREGRFGVTMELPPKLAALSEEETNKLIVAFTNRGASSGTYAGKSIEGSGATAKKTPTGSTPLNTVNTPAGGTPAAKQKPKPSMPTQTKLGIVLAVLATVLIANLIFNAATAVPPPAPLTLVDPAGLPCKEAFVAAEGSVICRVPAAFFKNPQSVIDAKAAVTHAAIKAQGLGQLFVYTIEDGKLLLTL